MLNRTVFSWAGGLSAVVAPIGVAALGTGSSLLLPLVLVAAVIGGFASRNADQFPDFWPPAALAVGYPLALWLAIVLESRNATSEIAVGPWTLMIVAVVAATVFAFRPTTPAIVTRTLRNVAVGVLLLGLPLYGVGLYMLPIAGAFYRGDKLRD